MRPSFPRTSWPLAAALLAAACADGLTTLADARPRTPAAARLAARACAITTTDLGTLGGTWSQAHDVDRFGRVVGASRTASGETHAFLWSDGTMIDLGTLGGGSSTANAINDRGQIVGVSATSEGVEDAFLWDRGVMHDLGPAVGSPSAAYDINARGQVVGGTVDGQGFLWDDTTTTFIVGRSVPDVVAHAINDDGLVVGSVGPWSFTWTQAAGMAYTGLAGEHSIAYDVSAHGDIVGWTELSGAPVRRHAYLVQDGVALDLGTLVTTPSSGPIGPSSAAFGINDFGQVVGVSASDAVPGGGPDTAFLWWQGTMTDLGALPGYTTSTADAISAAGDVVGWSQRTGATHATMWTLGNPHARACWGDRAGG